MQTAASPSRVYSRFDPSVHPPPFLRTPVLHDREFNYEANIFMLLWDHTPEKYARLVQTLPLPFLKRPGRIPICYCGSSACTNAEPILTLVVSLIPPKRFYCCVTSRTGILRPLWKCHSPGCGLSQPTVKGVMPLEGYDPIYESSSFRWRNGIQP